MFHVRAGCLHYVGGVGELPFRNLKCSFATPEIRLKLRHRWIIIILYVIFDIVNGV